MSWGRRAGLLVVTCLCAAALVLPASRAGAAVPTCEGSQLSMRVVSFEDASGYRLWQLAFKDLGGACSLQGFSRVQLLDQDGHRIRVGFRRETGFPASVVTLEPGQSAFVAFTYLDGRLCATSSFYAYRVRIVLPETGGAFVLDPMSKNGGPIFVCAKSKRVYPVTSKPGP
ncbi:MAG TPA: DUF4232 domain-containing protein [Solirubrobacteraceae bacterium]|nr:DUF4232 domain-containing protein [Solirubrobacteraceae bacterium]